MKPSEICVSTTTHARSVQEEQVLRASLRSLSKLQLPVYVADGGSPAPFVDYVRTLPGMVVTTPSRLGLVPQVRASFGAAWTAGHPFVLYTEADKAGFFEEGLVELVRRAPDDLGVIVAARSEDSFGTFPPLQRFTENTINRLTGNIVGKDGDYSYGPFLLNRSLIGHLDTVPDAIGWGWRHFLFATARKLGLEIHLVVDDYFCPARESEEDDDVRSHRMLQLSQNMEGLFLATHTEAWRS